MMNACLFLSKRRRSSRNHSHQTPELRKTHINTPRSSCLPLTARGADHSVVPLEPMPSSEPAPPALHGCQGQKREKSAEFAHVSSVAIPASKLFGGCGGYMPARISAYRAQRKRCVTLWGGGAVRLKRRARWIDWPHTVDSSLSTHHVVLAARPRPAGSCSTPEP